jgi:hypothetical protein
MEKEGGGNKGLRTTSKEGIVIVATLALGSWPRQGLTKVQAKREARESKPMLLGMQKSVKEWTLTLRKELPFWELESQWTFEYSKNNYRGQNLMDWRIPYIIEKLLEHRCLKWVRLTHSDTSNASYGQKKGRESNWQFDS